MLEKTAAETYLLYEAIKLIVHRNKELEGGLWRLMSTK